MPNLINDSSREARDRPFNDVFPSNLRGQVSKKKGAKENRADYKEWSVSGSLKPHPNVLRIIGLCPSFNHPSYKHIGTTALILPFQENRGLKQFFQQRALELFQHYVKLCVSTGS